MHKILKHIREIDFFNLFFPILNFVIELERNDLDRIRENNFKLAQNEKKYKKVKDNLYKKSINIINSTHE